MSIIEELNNNLKKIELEMVVEARFFLIPFFSLVYTMFKTYIVSKMIIALFTWTRSVLFFIVHNLLCQETKSVKILI